MILTGRSSEKRPRMPASQRSARLLVRSITGRHPLGTMAQLIVRRSMAHSYDRPTHAHWQLTRQHKPPPRSTATTSASFARFPTQHGPSVRAPSGSTPDRTLHTVARTPRPPRCVPTLVWAVYPHNPPVTFTSNNHYHVTPARSPRLAAHQFSSETRQRLVSDILFLPTDLQVNLGTL